MPKRLAITIYAVTAFFFLCFFAWPIFLILGSGFFDADGNLTLSYFLEVFANPLYLEGLRNSFGMAVFTTLLCMIIAVPLAFISDRFDFPGKGLFVALILLPIMLPPFVGAIGIRQILGQYGALNAFLETIGILGDGETIDWLGQGRFWGVVIMNALSLYPILYLNAVASLANIDPAMEEAAQNLGCTGFKRFYTITLPLMRPGLFAGSTIVFIWAFTELGVPLIFDYNRVTSVQIFNGLKDIGGNPFPYALTAVMLIFSILFYFTGKVTFGRNTFSMMAKASHARSARKLGPAGQAFCFGIFGLVVFLALIPHIGVVFLSFAGDWYNTILPSSWTLHNYDLALGHSLTVPAIRNSLIYSSAAVFLNIILGVGVAFVIVRSKLPGRSILDSIAMLPLAVPGLVVAFGYYAMSLPGNFFQFPNTWLAPFQWWNEVMDAIRLSFFNVSEFPVFALIIAYSIRKMPFIVRSAVAGLEQTSETYEEAAQNLGAPPVKAALKITIPLIFANLIAGGLLTFSQTMLEVSDSLILAQKQQYYPITKAIYDLMGFLGDGKFIACALGVWAMVFLGITIGGASMILGKKLGAIFRV